MEKAIRWLRARSEVLLILSVRERAGSGILRSGRLFSASYYIIIAGKGSSKMACDLESWVETYHFNLLCH